MAGNVDYIALRVARNAGGRVSPASASQADINALTARVTALEVATADAVIYIGSFSNMQDFTPVPAYADYLCFNETVGNAGQLWRWMRGSTAAVNGVTVVADPNPSTGRFILTSTF